MVTIKMVLDETWEDNALVFAIHCSIEDYRMAFMINKYLRLQLRRTSKDIDFTVSNYCANYPLFIFEDHKKYITYHLVGNRCKAKSNSITSNDGLFKDDTDEHFRVFNLLPEYARVDYLLKIETDSVVFPTSKVLADLNQIPQIITAYTIDINQLKSKTNLIFE